MAYSFAHFDGRAQEVVDWLGKEFSGIRTGRATPALLDSIQVESYGARVPINQVGNVTVEDARTLRISPWDSTSIKPIEKAITDADFGVSVSADDKGVRVTFPELTSDRRTQLLKLAKSRLEEARVSLRKARDEIVKDIDQKESESELSGDEKFRTKEELQKRVDRANEQLNALFEKKEKEIHS
ncbi:ribosome recycling factor [Candidatus Kaiserbacteria bacterium]|nr:ribosome recycling factor [Candidatus Kaiserbacteria bacterium]